jgi:hypothetical protein
MARFLALAVPANAQPNPPPPGTPVPAVPTAIPVLHQYRHQRRWR